MKRRCVAASGLVLVVVLIVATACGREASVPEAPKIPAGLLPAEIDGMSVREEPEASLAYKKAGTQSMVALGTIYTMRRNDLVQAALQVAVLKPQFDTREDEIRRGVRNSIENGIYRYFKVSGHWVGEQRLAEIGLYLWFPKRGDSYELLVVRPELGIPKDLLKKVIDHQRENGI